MRHLLYISALILLLVSQVTLICGQSKPQDNPQLKDGRGYFKIDSRWTPEQLSAFMKRNFIDSVVVAKALKGDAIVVNGVEEWAVKHLQQFTIELSKSINASKKPWSGRDLVMVDDEFIADFLPAAAVEANYGVNSYNTPGIFSYSNGAVTLILPKFTKASKVCLSGSFNSWSTEQIPMNKTAEGWSITLKLPEGKHLYKYIVDGRWIEDPFNRNKERNEHGTYNSIFYCYSYSFHLNGYPEARNVFVSGSFNSWRKDELRMVKGADGWSLPLYLRDGTHAYKFIVDGTWITDPANKQIRPDGRGNTNSFIGIGDTAVFKLNGYSTANRVALAGNFNGWNGNEQFMEKTFDGWILPYVLGRGNYEYKFVVDGKWMPDPANPYTTGSGNYTNSCLTVGPSHVFKLNGFENAKRVIVTGSFNNWSKDGYRMVKVDGVWSFPLYLKPGKYTYKFIVDGEWMIDPANGLYEMGNAGADDSILWIEF